MLEFVELGVGVGGDACTASCHRKSDAPTAGPCRGTAMDGAPATHKQKCQRRPNRLPTMVRVEPWFPRPGLKMGLTTRDQPPPGHPALKRFKDHNQIQTTTPDGDHREYRISAMDTNGDSIDGFHLWSPWREQGAQHTACKRYVWTHMRNF